MYDRIEDTEKLLIDARAKKRAIEADKVRGDNIYRILTHFEKMYSVMNEQERQDLMQALIAEIHIFETPQPNGQWLKSIKFRLPIIDGPEDVDQPHAVAGHLLSPHHRRDAAHPLSGIVTFLRTPRSKQPSSRM